MAYGIVNVPNKTYDDAIATLNNTVNSLSSNKVSKSGDTITGALNFANATWNLVGNDIYMGDHNVAGGLCLKGNTGTTNLTMYSQDETTTATITQNGTGFTLTGTTSGTFSGDLNGNATTSNAILMNDTGTLEASGVAGAPSANVFAYGIGCGGIYLIDNAPCNYGNLITIYQKGAGQLVLEWLGQDNVTGRIYYRSHRDTNNSGYGNWKTVSYVDDSPSPDLKELRSIYAGTDDMTANSTTLATGTVYLCYE